jgi:hypothetical protein
MKHFKKDISEHDAKEIIKLATNKSELGMEDFINMIMNTNFNI